MINALRVTCLCSRHFVHMEAEAVPKWSRIRVIPPSAATADAKVRGLALHAVRANETGS
jgi:hypothetical protein